MTTIKFPPHNQAIPVTYRVDELVLVVTIQPSDYEFVLKLSDNAQLFGEFGLEPMKVNSLSGLNHEKLG